jgi:hypothetical protein
VPRLPLLFSFSDFFAFPSPELDNQDRKTPPQPTATNGEGDNSVEEHRDDTRRGLIETP